MNGAQTNISAGERSERTERFAHDRVSFVSFVPCVLCALTPSSAARTSTAPASRTRRRTPPACRSTSIAVGSSGGDASSAAVPRTPAMITGMVIGYNRIGSITSRVRARTSIAANSVPTAQNPIVPPASSADQQQRPAEQRRLEQQRDQRHQQQLGERRAAPACRAACRRRAPGAAPAPAAARAASRRSARARRCGRAPACRKTRSRSTGCRPRRRPPARPSLTNANAKISTHDTAKNSVVVRTSQLFASIATSFRSTSSAVRKNISARPDRARGSARAGPATAGSSDEQPAVAHQRDARHQAVGEIEIVRREHDDRAAGGQRAAAARRRRRPRDRRGR